MPSCDDVVVVCKTPAGSRCNSEACSVCDLLCFLSRTEADISGSFADLYSSLSPLLSLSLCLSLSSPWTLLHVFLAFTWKHESMLSCKLLILLTFVHLNGCFCDVIVVAQPLRSAANFSCREGSGVIVRSGGSSFSLFWHNDPQTRLPLSPFKLKVWCRI